jgi:NADH:ubiquinone oxidoreductase subunit 2 (subunit N)
MIAGVILYALVPIAAAGVFVVFRRLHAIIALLAAGIAGVLGVAALWLPMDRIVVLGGRQVALGESVELLGRQLVITDAERALLATLFLMAAGLFLFGLRSGTGPLFFPVGMAVLGLQAAALVVRPFVYSALLLTISAMLATILLAEVGQTRGALRYLVLMTLALPTFMLANWMADQYVYNPTDATLPRNIMLLLAGGFTLLLGVIPFHIWIRPSVEDAPPLASAFVLTVCNSVNWFLLFNVLQEHPWLVTQQDIFRFLQLLGLLTAGAGAVLAFSSYDFAQVMGYGVLADYGCALLTLGTRTPNGLSAAMMALLVRPASLAILALGLTLARERLGSTRFEKLAGLGWRNPWTATALIVGGFSLAGIPPLAGFTARWSEIRLLATSQPLYVLVIFAATLGVSAGALRGMEFLLQPPPEPARVDGSASGTGAIRKASREPRVMAALIVLSLLAGLALALSPSLIEPIIRAVASSYTFFSAP